MKLNYAKLINVKRGLEFLETKEMNYRAALKISKNLKTIQELLVHYVEESAKLESEFLEKDESGNYIEEGGGLKLKSETKDKYWEKKKELDEFEVDVYLYQINVSDLDEIKIMPEIAGAIECIVRTVKNDEGRRNDESR